MITKVACRGCGTEVAADADTCFVCRCPAPTCHIDHLVPDDFATPVQAKSKSVWPWLWFSAIGLVSLAILAGAIAWLLVTH